ncbi:MAG: hypothetical protein PHQ43_06380 [Dehalococcoidales bacterium]|nr:hypothetical protein [Dehalococcoidales bacterium]
MAKDNIQTIALVGGTIAIGAGLYFYTRKPKGVDPGGKLTAVVSFDYFGQGGTYVVQVALGHLRFGIFDNIEGLRFSTEIALPAPSPKPERHQVTIELTLPEGMDDGTYDAEALIRYPYMDIDEYIIRIRTESAVIVR